MVLAGFSLGTCVATPGALAALQRCDIAPSVLLDRHSAGDWGELGRDDKRANDDAIKHGMRVLSKYVYGDERFYVITEWDRSVTTLMLVSDY